MVFIGWTLASVIVPRISDLYGRKTTFLVNMAAQFISLICMIYTKSYLLMQIALFVLGVCSVGRWTVTYIYLCEFWTEKNIKRFGPFINVSAAITLLVGAFTFQFLTRNIIYLEYAAVLMTIVSGCLSFMLIPESPKWLIG